MNYLIKRTCIKRIGFVILLIIHFAGCTNKAQDSFYGNRQSNLLKKRFHIPIIDSNLVLGESAISPIYWYSPQKYPIDSVPLHAWKGIMPGPGVTFLTFESDAFRMKIDDTLFFQLNVDSKLLRDSSVSISGLVFYSHTNESRSISMDNKYKSLDSAGVDSVKRSWGLAF